MPNCRASATHVLQLAGRKEFFGSCDEHREPTVAALAAKGIEIEVISMADARALVEGRATTLTERVQEGDEVKVRTHHLT